MAQNVCRILGYIYRTNQSLMHHQRGTSVIVTQVRGRKRWLRPYFRDLYKRREEQGPEPERHRSAWRNWNYDSEMYAFGQRLKEDFQDNTLRKIFTHRSYVEQQNESSESAGMTTLPVEDNTDFIQAGELLTTSYIKAFLRHAYPALPEEGICSVADYLMTEDMLSDIASKIGVNDLILSAEFPVSSSTLRASLMAVIGGLQNDQGTEQAEIFIQDFILTMLVGKDVMEIWQLVNPMGVLQSIVQHEGRGEIESRLLYETGSNTVLAAYMVGVYSDKQLLGKGYGETVNTAEEMAARDALRHYFGTALHSKPLPFGPQGHKQDIDFNKINNSVKDFLSPSQLQ